MDIVWRKSSRSNTQGGNCVEVATLPGRVLVRDSKHPDGGTLAVTPETFTALLTDAKAGNLDLA